MDDNDDETPDHDTGNALGRIARILDVPTASFFGPEPSPTAGGTEAAATDNEIAQALAVMRLFLRLRDPEARALRFVHHAGIATRQVTVAGNALIDPRA